MIMRYRSLASVSYMFQNFMLSHCFVLQANFSVITDAVAQADYLLRFIKLCDGMSIIVGYFANFDFIQHEIPSSVPTFYYIQTQKESSTTPHPHIYIT